MPKGLPFSVDTWSPSSKSIKRHHFLTHAHKDHSSSITSHASFPICSNLLTKTPLLQQYPQLDASFFLSIKVGQSSSSMIPPVLPWGCDVLVRRQIWKRSLLKCPIHLESRYMLKNPESFKNLVLTVPGILCEDPSSRFHLLDGSPRLYERAKAKLIEAKATLQPEPLIIRPSAQWYACEEEFSDVENTRKKRTQSKPQWTWPATISIRQCCVNSRKSVLYFFTTLFRRTKIGLEVPPMWVTAVVPVF
ncbi:hypothetical protein VNO77_27352 [Canavalia gladiata]|uniref:Uncharacterized protein n=1 Tax=Canavalia gladiata TaxID=3824 RepID=A0AAN9Q439_CANGL